MPDRVAVTLARGLLEIAELAMPASYFASDSRCRLARAVLARAEADAVRPDDWAGCWPPCAGCIGMGPCDLDLGQRDECGDCALEADHLPSPCRYGPDAEREDDEVEEID